MNKTIWFLLVIWLTACAPVSAKMISAPQGAAAQAALPTLQRTPTGTPEPTATMDAQATIAQAQAQIRDAQNQAQQAQAVANSAMQTANALLQSGIEVTQQAQALVMQSRQLTAQVDKWTAEAPATPTPNATGTAVKLALDAAAITAISVHSTSVAEAPTQVVRMAVAQANADNADLDHKVNTIAPFVAAFAAIVLVALVGFFAIGLAKPNETIENEHYVQPDSTADYFKRRADTTIAVKTLDHGFDALQEMTFRCTLEEFDELAVGLIEKGWPSIAYTKWEAETKTRPRVSRETIDNVRDDFVRFLLAFRTPTQNVYPTPEGKQFLREYLNTRTIPHNVHFSPNIQPETGKNLHSYDSHSYDNGGGGGSDMALAVLTPLPTYHPSGFGGGK